MSEKICFDHPSLGPQGLNILNQKVHEQVQQKPRKLVGNIKRTTVSEIRQKVARIHMILITTHKDNMFTM